MSMREMSGKVEDWDPVQKRGNACSSLLVEPYLTCVSNTQRQVGVPVEQAAPLLTHDFARLLQDLRQRAQSESLKATRIEITRDIALFSLAFDSMRRGYDPPFTLDSQVMRLSESAGLIFNFLFGKTWRRSTEVVVVLADKECPQVCAFRAVAEYISAVKKLWLGFDKGLLIPRCPRGRGPGTGKFADAAHDGDVTGEPSSSGKARPPYHALLVGRRFRKHAISGYSSRRDHEDRGVEDREDSKVLYIGSTTSARVPTSRKRDHDYENASDSRLSSAFKKGF